MKSVTIEERAIDTPQATDEDVLNGGAAGARPGGITTRLSHCITPASPYHDKGITILIRGEMP